MQKLKDHLTKKNILIFSLITLTLAGGFFLFSFAKGNKQIISVASLNVLNKFSSFLPITADEKKELSVVDSLVQAFTKQDGIEKKFLLLLQNNMELRPGGGFLGQYAIIKVKDGVVTSSAFEDANLLDQRITAKINPPYPFKRMMQIKKWKFRDSNFSPDFQTNAEKAKYFMRLSGRDSNFDGVIAVNSEVLESVLRLTGPLEIPTYNKTFTSENVVLDLEASVEKRYILSKEAGVEIDTQNRKAIMKQMTQLLMQKLFTVGNIAKVAELFHQETKNKNIMVNFKDENLQKLIESVYWDGRVSQTWVGDYLMVVDANMGSLKSDYYIKREISYDVDLTQPKPVVNLNIKYLHTATYGDWRTSDYHSYLRVYVPQGANLLEQKMVGSPNIQEEFGKTYFGFIAHTIIGSETDAYIKYELPENIDRENYRLLVQKQSGVGDVPIKIHIKSSKGETTQEQILKTDTAFKFIEQ